MPLVVPQFQTISVGDTEMVAVNYTDWLDSGELLTGTPTVTEQTTSDLTLSNKSVSTGALTIFGESVAAGAAVQFSVAGQQDATTYTIQITVSTDATPARTCVREVRIAAT